jgi:hypothetical protein
MPYEMEKEAVDTKLIKVADHVCFLFRFQSDMLLDQFQGIGQVEYLTE